MRCGVLGDGPDVVLCHVTPWSSWLWGDVAHDLARDHRVHVRDMPGFGASSKDAEHAVTLASQGAVLADDDAEARLGEVATPTFVVWGEQDAWIPVDLAHRLAAEIPGALVATIADAGHLVQLDAGATLTGVLRAWLVARESHDDDPDLVDHDLPPDAA